MLDFLERRDDALVQRFFNVLERSSHRHIVDYILDTRNCANATGISWQQCGPHQSAGLQPRVDQGSAVGGRQLNPCVCERKMMNEQQASACVNNATVAARVNLGQNMLASDVEVDCPLSQNSNTLVSETVCKVVDSSPPPGRVASASGAMEEVGCAQSLEFMDPERPLAAGPGLESGEIELREYQKELSRAGIEGRNVIICAPTGSGKTYTAGYICQQRRLRAKKEGRRFKAVFIVCIRNLITQQSDALVRIIGSDVVRGVDDKLTLATLIQYFDVVVATAQVNYHRIV